MDNNLPVKSDILIYQAEDGKTHIDVRLEDETVWLTQSGIAELFQITKQNVSLHLKNIYDEKELVREATVKECLTVQKEGGRAVKRRIEDFQGILCNCSEQTSFCNSWSYRSRTWRTCGAGRQCY